MMLAGPPAAKTRSTRAGTSTVRPALSVTGRPWTGPGAATRSARSAAPAAVRVTLVLAHHDVGRLDDRVGLVALAQVELVDGLIGDRGGDDGAVDVDLDVGGGRAPGDLDHAALQHVARAQL